MAERSTREAAENAILERIVSDVSTTGNAEFIRHLAEAYSLIAGVRKPRSGETAFTG